MRNNFQPSGASYLQLVFLLMLHNALPDRLPDGVCEVIPGTLYVGGVQVVSDMILHWNVRSVVRCMEEPCDYQHILDDVWVAEASKQFEANIQRGEVAETEEESPTSSCPACGSCEDDDEAAPTVDDVVRVPDGPPSHPPPPSREDWLRQRPPSHTVRTFHCPMEDSLQFSFLDCDAFAAAMRFVDDAILQTGTACLGQWEVHGEETADDAHDEKDDDEHGRPPADEPRAQPAIYVHCQAGHSRSPALVLAYLMTRRGMSLQEGVDALAPRMRPNPNFIKQLLRMEDDLLSSQEPARGGRVPFDLRRYFVDGLAQMHPSLPEEIVTACLDACGGDVESARMLLTKKAFEFAREKASVDSLLAIVNEGGTSEDFFTESEVRGVFLSSEKNRAAALRHLLTLQTERRAQREGRGAGPMNFSKSS